MTGFPTLDAIRAAGARAPRPSRGRFRAHWDGAAAWTMPAAPVPEGRALGAAWRIEAAATPATARWIAHAIRQDLWRALRSVRGFWPVVRVAPGQEGHAGGHIDIAAGGVLPLPVPPGLSARVAAVATPARQRQWLDWAAAKADHQKRDRGTCSRRS